MKRSINEENTLMTEKKILNTKKMTINGECATFFKIIIFHKNNKFILSSKIYIYTKSF